MTLPGTSAASAELEEGLGPALLVRGELSVFLARLDDGGQPGRRMPVVTLRAPALLATASPPPGTCWLLGPGLGNVT